MANLIGVLGPIFSDPQVGKVGLNLKYDAEVLEEHGFKVRGMVFDGMLAAYVLHPDRRDYGLKSLAKSQLGETMKTFKEVCGDAAHIGEVPLAEVSAYACHDAEISWRLQEVLLEKLGERSDDEPTLREVFEELEMSLVPVLVAMERAGIKLDIPFLNDLSKEFTAEIDTLEQQIYKAAGVAFNINSPKQLSGILFEHLELPTKGIKKTTLGYSTNATALYKLESSHEIIPLLLNYREVHKLRSTYVDALRKLVDPETMRIHASFNQAIAATGRLSSSDPNLQNIPIRNPRGRKIRQAFIAEEGHVLLSADYSQVELRVLAHLSKDAGLISAFCEGEDIHMRTAKELFGVMISEDEKPRLRRIAKTINFGIVYGMSAFRLAREIGVSNKQAQQYIEEYFARYPKIQEYFDGLVASAENLGYVETMHGRRRFIEELNTSGRDAGYASRSMNNAPIQGSAAEIMKMAMIRVHDALEASEYSARILLQVHDELVIEVPEAEVDEVWQLVVKQMQTAVKLEVPLLVDVAVGQNWDKV